MVASTLKGAICQAPDSKLISPGLDRVYAILLNINVLILLPRFAIWRSSADVVLRGRPATEVIARSPSQATPPCFSQAATVFRTVWSVTMRPPVSATFSTICGAVCPASDMPKMNPRRKGVSRACEGGARRLPIRSWEARELEGRGGERIDGSVPSQSHKSWSLQRFSQSPPEPLLEGPLQALFCDVQLAERTHGKRRAPSRGRPMGALLGGVLGCSGACSFFKRKERLPLF